ncbi:MULTISPECIES: glycosyltransferase [unclassified Sphingomonas]|uniref:glycosyltransferase n=1 Tax=unclassified Sphingomonas TaxID=196159 RepID=UPI00092AE435|nr:MULTISPECIES: glycosyltransferase [unclassified Sphingomonas]OJV30010.1 MAG: glycosyl transferase family 2 [Sphingomonas sp. 67-36]
MIAALALAIWLVLVFARHGFWLARERDTRDLPPEPAHWPAVAAVVPARDEAEVIAEAIGSLIAQDYPGSFRVILVDDSSSDGTGDIARGLGAARLEVLASLPLSVGWTGKLWAVRQGVERAGNAPTYLWLTDADIAHAPDTLRTLVARAEAGDLALVSLMAKLRCETLAERMLIPAFVFFFQMLYPFGLVNRATGPGGAAGGCMLVRRAALEAAGGIAAIRDALIDDCTLGALLKRQGRIWLGLTDRSRSIRRYETFGSVAAMISRSAYAQLRYSPWLLAGTLLGLALVYLVPPVAAIFASGLARLAGLAAWALMAIAFQPMLAFYRRSPLWGVALPVIAAFYAGCTLLSAWQHARGRGGMWKGRAQAAGG